MPPSAIRPLLGLLLMLPLLGAETAEATPERALVVVGSQPGEIRAAERLVQRLGGDVGQRLPIVDGFSARVPVASVALLRRAGSVRTVARDVALTLATALPIDRPPAALAPGDPVVGGKDPVPAAPAPDARGKDLVRAAPAPLARGKDLVRAAPGPAARARASIDLIRASAGAHGGLTGAGVDVALIDSGVVGVAALDGPGKLVRGPDFSADARDRDLRGLDGFGHGSHMAGLIAADDAASGYQGIAPGARLVSVKVAGADGVTSLGRVLTALDWVRRKRSSGGLDIRVVNLSFGVDARRSYVREPLAYAAE
jgi:serine protease AprX